MFPGVIGGLLPRHQCDEWEHRHGCSESQDGSKHCLVYYWGQTNRFNILSQENEGCYKAHILSARDLRDPPFIF